MRVAIISSAPVAPDIPARVREGLHPRNDLLALAQGLGAELITPEKLPQTPGGAVSKSRALFLLAWTAFQRRRQYDLIISDTDRVGLILALLFRLTGTRKGHVVICHGKMATPGDLRVVRAFGLQKHIHRFVCYGPTAARKIEQALPLPRGQVVAVRHPADHHFWRPQPSPAGDLVVSAGMMRRDYPTLVEAVRGQDVSLTIAAYSPWMATHRDALGTRPLPANVRTTRCDYQGLRDLYAQALCVAVPLHRSSGQSGSLVVYEAMAMGKPVLATRTLGQEDLGIIEDGETGYYVTPQDVMGWRDRINYLHNHPQQAAAMGQRARAVVEAGLNLDGYVADMVSVIEAVAETIPVSGGRRSRMPGPPPGNSP